MLVALLPTQVDKYWGMIKDNIEDDLPPIANADFNLFLYSLMVGMMHCWLYTDGKDVQGFVLTTFITDTTGLKTLMIYNVVVFDKTAKVDWMKEFNTLKIFAFDAKCHKIGAFVANEKVVKALEECGFSTNFTYVNCTV